MPDTDERPDVVWICTDQQYAGAVGAVNDRLETPGMDRVAAGGTRFSNAYCTNPLCTPSRASMLTGRMPSTVGVVGNRSGIDDEYREEELGRLFDAVGYDCAYAGKWHVADSRHVEDGHGFTELCGMDDIRAPEACVDFISDREEGDDPFLLGLHLDNPHNICEWSRDFTPPWGSVEDVPVEECPPLPANHAPPPNEPKAVRDVVEGHWAMGAMEGATPAEWRQYRSAYYRLIERADAGVARVLDALEAEGLAEDALVVFTSDHGDGHGAHRLIQKTFLYEEMARVPLFVSPPGTPLGTGEEGTDERTPPASSDRLVSTGLDLLPTLCDYAGIEAPADLPGRSLRPLVAGEDPAWRDRVVTETIAPDEGLDGRMIRTERYKYVVYHEGRHNEQLFDLENDPGEMVDLSDDAAHRDVLEAHRERLLEWCLETDDRFGARYHHPDVPMIPGRDFEELWPQFTDDPPGHR
jgi:arylsulfatase A-like enzyme